MSVDQVVKRDGRVVPFDRSRIERAIYAAARAVGNGEGRPWAEMLSWAVVGILEERYGQKSQTPQVEEVQDIVEEVLIKSGHPTVAKAYILYRQKRADARAAERMLMDTEKLVDDYLQKLDWRIAENSNMNYSLQGLNFYLASSIAARYWLDKIYPPEVQRAHTEGAVHIHDLGMLSSYTYYGKEVVVLRVDGDLRLTSFEQAYAGCPEAETCLNEADSAFAKYPQNWEVLDQDGWTPVRRLVRKRKYEGMRFIKNRGGRSVIVTDNHPMITGSGAVRAADVTPRSDALYTVDLPRLLAGEDLFAETEIDMLAELQKAGVTRFGKDHIYFNGLAIDEAGFSPDGEGLLHTHTRTIPRRIPLTADLGYFVGFVLAEGYLSYDSKAPRTISVAQKDAAALHAINRALIALGTPGCITQREGTGMFDLQTRNVFLRFLFEQVFAIQPGARHKSLPVRILHYNQDFVQGLLAGIIDGDGSVDGARTSTVIRVSARTLLEQMAYVLHLLKATPRDRNIEGVGTRRTYKGREIVQNYPLYGLSFRKTDVLTLPSTRVQATAVSTRTWQDETRDEWHTVLNNEPTEIPDDDIYDITTESGTLIVNGMWNHNCSGWDLQDLLMQGFGGVSAKIESRPPRHLRTALGQLVNFFYTLQGEVAGAVAVSNLDTLLAPFIRYDRLDYTGIKQAVQEFVFNINVPTRVGFQSLIWDELVVVKNRGRIEVVEIGQLVDGQFDRNGHRVLSQGHSSYAVANADDYRALTFDADGQVHWAPVKAFIRHRVPQGSAFVRVRTSRGTAGVSQAHSMFAFAELNGHCTAQPIAANQVEIAHGNATLSPHNHLVAVRRVANEGSRRQLDLVELIDAVPQLAERVRVRDSGVALPYLSWRAASKDAPTAELSLDDQEVWYGRILVGEGLEEFVRLVGRYIARNQGEAADGLLDVLVGQLVGTASTNKLIPWFIYDLAPEYQESLIATLMRGDGSETPDHYDYTTTSKKLSLGLSLLLAMNGYKFSVYENSYDDRPNWSDQYTLRIYKDKAAREGYDIGDLIARACTRREDFSYQREYEYDISVDAACENFAGGSGLLCFHNTPFTNITMDLTPPSTLRDQAVVIGGELQEATYGEFQKEMDQLNHAFAEVMLEGDSKARVFSVDYSSYSPVREDGIVRLVRIGEYIDAKMQSASPMRIEDNQAEVLDVRHLNIETVGIKGGQIDWHQVLYLVRHPADQVLRITATGGFHVSVTSSHSVLTLREGEIVACEASSLRPGDYLLAPEKLDMNETAVAPISLAHAFGPNAEGIYLHGARHKDGSPYKESRTSHGKKEYGYRVSTVPLSHVYDILDELDLSEARIGLAGSNILIPNTIQVNNALMEFLGYYVAEGSAEKGKFGGISLGFNLTKERDLANRIAGWVGEVFAEAAVREIPERNLAEVRCHSKLLRRVMTEVFGVVNGVERRVPDLVFSVPDELKRAFLWGYFDGDASWGEGAAFVNTIAPGVAYGISTLLKQFGTAHTWTEYLRDGRHRVYRVNLWDVELAGRKHHTLCKLPIEASGLGSVLEAMRQREPEYRDSLGRRRRNSPTRVNLKYGIAHQESTSVDIARRIIADAEQMGIEIPQGLRLLVDSDLLYLKIKTIEEQKATNGMVYDFSTTSESFMANQILVHNTFPIPTYNLTRDFEWDNTNLEPVWRMTAKYGIPYFCLAEDTAVLLSDHSSRPIKQIQVGDLLVGADGSPAKVSQVYHRKAAELVRITLKDGQVISATPTHRFPTERGLKEAGELSLGDKLVRTVGSAAEYEPIISLQFVTGDFAVVDVTVDSKEHLFALSGGTLSHNSNYINSDMNPEDARSMCPLSPDTQVLVKDDRDASIRTMQEVYDAYMKQGVLPQVLHDGEWHPAVPVATKTIGCREFALANGARVTMDLRHEQPARRGEDLPAELLQAAEIRAGMYLPFAGTHGEGDFRWYPVESIREVAGYNGPVYCFAVDSPEHLFQTANGLITHNCRLRLDHRELRKRMGGLFAAAPLTGSAGVVTINLPRLAYLAHDEDDFRKQLEQMMEISRTSLEIKRKMLETLTDRGLYPYSRHYLHAVKAQTGGYWNHHFSTIGLIGMNEASLNLLGVGIADPKGKDLAVRTLEFMREVIFRFQQETGNLYNLEATPAEGASYRLARADKQAYPNIKTAGTEKTPYYTNSSQMPVNYSDDLFQVLDHQDELQTLYTGGTVVHIFLGEQLNDWRQARRLVRTVAENYRLPYFTLSPTFSICPVHGYIPGEHKFCPYEHTEEDLKKYGRPVS